MSEFRLSILSVLFAALLGTSSFGHSPVDFLEVLSVEPARPIQHDVELQSMFDKGRKASLLEGPQFFSRSVGGMDKPAKKKLAYLTWFRIVDAPEEPVRQVSILDMVRGGSSDPLKIQAAEYLLCPSQLITTGPPDSVPFGLDYFKAYRVVDAPRSIARLF